MQFEAKDTAALDLILADTLAAVDTDGSVANKAEYLAGIKVAGQSANLKKARMVEHGRRQ